MIQLSLESSEENSFAKIILLANTSLDTLKEKFSAEESQYLKKQFDHEQSIISLRKIPQVLWVVAPPKKLTENTHTQNLEAYRRLGGEIQSLIQKENITEVQLIGKNPTWVLAFTEGLSLSLYQFSKYLKESKAKLPQKIYLNIPEKYQSSLEELSNLLEAGYYTRDLVNEPVVYLTAVQLSQEIQRLGKEAGFATEVFHKEKIQALQMNGILTVNKGSIQPPTFNVLEHKPKNPLNQKPIILVGKGVVFDTGGLSLKPTISSMDFMKADMAGAATVVGSLYAIAKNNLPFWVIGLIPATDNRPGQNAIAPGDVITYSNGVSVEIMHTDAEGRLILADALIYAQKYSPELVIDFATLTGAAVVAAGKHASIMMGNAGEQTKKALSNAGEQTYERLAEFPFFEEYAELNKSDIADIRNLAITSEAGSITAGKFLERFTDYPWLHFDIAGTAYLHQPITYLGKYATAVGVRLIYQYLKNKI